MDAINEAAKNLAKKINVDMSVLANTYVFDQPINAELMGELQRRVSEYMETLKSERHIGPAHEVKTGKYIGYDFSYKRRILILHTEYGEQHRFKGKFYGARRLRKRARYEIKHSVACDLYLRPTIPETYISVDLTVTKLGEKLI